MPTLGYLAFKRIKSVPSRTYLKPLAGFTLIEMLITISIISILLSSMVSSSSLGRREFILTSSQQQLRAIISRAKSLSLSTALSTLGTICGYGVRIDKDSKTAFIFRDLKISANCPGDNIYSAGGSEKLGGSLNEIKLDNSLSFSGNTDVVFIPPDPTTIINGDPNSLPVEIVIKAGDNNIRKIIINKAGLIDLTSK